MTPETILSALRAEHEASVRLHQHHLDSLTHEDGIRRVLHLHAGHWGIVRDGESLVVRSEGGEFEGLRCPCCGGDRLAFWESDGSRYILSGDAGQVLAAWKDHAFEPVDDGRIFCQSSPCFAEFTVPEVPWEWA